MADDRSRAGPHPERCEASVAPNSNQKETTDAVDCFDFWRPCFRPLPRPRPLTRAPFRPSSSPAWQAKTRELFKQAIEIPRVHNRGEIQRVAKLLADQFRAAGIPDGDIHFMPYEALPGDKTRR